MAYNPGYRNDPIFLPYLSNTNDNIRINPETGEYEVSPNTTSTSSDFGNLVLKGTVTAPFEWHIGPYFFDAWLNCSQSSTVTITSHPVAIGANVSDHAYSEPLEFSFEIGVSNTVANNFFDGASSRAVNAYTLLTKLQAQRQFIEIGTKYGTYQNILIKNITVNDTFDTQDTMKALITLQEVITANSQTYQVSANRQATDQTNRGNVTTEPELGNDIYRKYIRLKLKADSRAALS